MDSLSNTLSRRPFLWVCVRNQLFYVQLSLKQECLLTDITNYSFKRT